MRVTQGNKGPLFLREVGVQGGTQGLVPVSWDSQQWLTPLRPMAWTSIEQRCAASRF